MQSPHFNATVYPASYDPAPGRGHRPAFVGITFRPTPNLTRDELGRMIDDLEKLYEETNWTGAGS